MTFLCDEVQKYAVDNLNTAAGKQFADPASSETLIVAACRVTAIPSASTPRVWDPQQPAGAFRAAIGLPAVPPIAGTYYIGFGVKTSGTITNAKRYLIVLYRAGDDFTNVGGTNVTGNIFTSTGTTPTTWSNVSILTEITSDIPYNAAFSAVNTALNLLASITTAGGVVVTLNGASFLIAFNTVGSREEISADASNLAPTGTIAEVGTDLDGSASVREVQYLRFVQQPAAFVDLVTAAPGPAGTVDVPTVGGAGPPAVNATYRVTLFTSDLNQAYDGRWSITVLAQTSGLIPFDASGDAAQTILEAMAAIGTGNVSVFRESPGVYLIGFQGAKAGTNTGTMTVDTSALKTVPYMTGELDLSNPAIQLLFGTAPTVAALFVIEYTPSGGNRREICRRAITLDQALIADGSLTPTPRFSFYTTAETYSKSEVDAFFSGLVLGTLASQNANSAAITGGTGDNLTLTNTLLNGLTIDDFSLGSVSIENVGDSSSLALGVATTVVFFTGKTVNFTSSITFSGTDGSTLDIGAGGTLDAGAFAPVSTSANPTATIGLTAVNGVATTFLASDSAPALSQAIVPTWTGAHTFNAAVSIAGTLALSNTITFTPANKSVTLSPTGTGTVTIAPATAGTISNIAISATTLAASGLASLLGGLKLTYAQKTAGYTFAATDFAIEATANTFTLTLPTAAGRIGQPFLAANSGSGVITLSTTGGQTINALASISISQGAAFMVMSNGSNWIITGSYGAASSGSFTTLTASGATTFTAGTATSSATTGTVVVTGGIGASGTIWAGGNLTTDGNLVGAVVGKGVTIKAGTNGRIGTATLVGGTVTVGCTNITTSTRVQLTRITAGGTLGAGGYGYTISAGTSFTINSLDTAGVLSILDTSTLNYVLVEQT